MRRQRGPPATRPLDAGVLAGRIEALARQGQRVLAVAVKTMPAGQRDLRFADVEAGLPCSALLGLIDPPREEAIAAVRATAARPASG